MQGTAAGNGKRATAARHTTAATSPTRRVGNSNSPPPMQQQGTATQWREWSSAASTQIEQAQDSVAAQTSQVELARESVAARLAEASQSGDFLASLTECAEPVTAGAASERSHQQEKETDEAQAWWDSCRWPGSLANQRWWNPTNHWFEDQDQRWNESNSSSGS